MRRFVTEWKRCRAPASCRRSCSLGLRDPMVKLAGDIADGLVFANAARSHMQHSLSLVPEAKRNDPAFFVGNMIPICISDDVAAAAAVNRKTLSGYVTLPNYREYWKRAGYVEEMTAIEQALARGERDALPPLMSDRWLADTTLYGPAAKVREGFEAWQDAGVQPILVPRRRRQSDEGDRGALRGVRRSVVGAIASRLPPAPRPRG
jgi:hypothetical protein